MACLRLVTFRPEPLLSVPFFLRRIADATVLDADFPYLAMTPSRSTHVMSAAMRGCGDGPSAGSWSCVYGCGEGRADGASLPYGRRRICPGLILSGSVSWSLFNSKIFI